MPLPSGPTSPLQSPHYVSGKEVVLVPSEDWDLDTLGKRLNEWEALKAPIPSLDLNHWTGSQRLIKGLRKYREDALSNAKVSDYTLQERIKYLSQAITDTLAYSIKLEVAMRGLLHTTLARLQVTAVAPQTKARSKLPSAEDRKVELTKFLSTLTDVSQDSAKLIIRLVVDHTHASATAFIETIRAIEASFHLHNQMHTLNGTEFRHALQRREIAGLRDKNTAIGKRLKHHRTFTVADVEDELNNFNVKLNSLDMYFNKISSKFALQASVVSAHRAHMTAQKDCTSCSQLRTIISVAHSNEQPGADARHRENEISTISANFAAQSTRLAELEAAATQINSPSDAKSEHNALKSSYRDLEEEHTKLIDTHTAMLMELSVVTQDNIVKDGVITFQTTQTAVLHATINEYIK